MARKTDDEPTTADELAELNARIADEAAAATTADARAKAAKPAKRAATRPADS